MFISIVICTRNRALQLEKAFDHWQRVDFSGCLSEFVIVNNGSTDKTAAVIDDFAKCSPVPVNALNVNRPGLGRARQHGSMVAKGSVLFFTDDDCYPATDILHQIRGVFADPELGYCGGKTLLHDSSHHPVTIQLLDEHVDIMPHSFIRAGFIHGANMSIRKAALIDSGGFDEHLGAGTPFFSGEDVDVQCRISWKGWKGAYSPSIVVLHDHGRTRPEEVKRLKKGYGIGRGAYYCKAILNSKPRRTYMRHWYWSIRASSLRNNLHEFHGFFSYLFIRVKSGFRSSPTN